jgi:hypothetical protein
MRKSNKAGETNINKLTTTMNHQKYLSAAYSAFAKDVALEPKFAMNLKRLGHEAKKPDQINA